MLSLMKSKLLTFIISFIALNVLALLFLPTSVSAATCRFNVHADATLGKIPDQDMNTLDIVIETRDMVLDTTKEYRINLSRPGGVVGAAVPGVKLTNIDPVTGARLSFLTNETAIRITRTGSHWISGEYRITLDDGGGLGGAFPKEVCTPLNTFSIEPKPAFSCKVEITTTDIDPTKQIAFNLVAHPGPTGSLPPAGATFRTYINGILNGTFISPSGILSTQPPGNLYKLEIMQDCDDTCRFTGRRLQCDPAWFDVREIGKPGGGQLQPPAAAAIKPGELTKLSSIGCNYQLKLGVVEIPNPAITPRPQGILTAIGCLPTQPGDLITTLYVFIILGIGGTITFLLMIAGVFEMITSGGSPEALKKGQERFFSALQGFLFIILSLLILQIIGADILNIPGFK